MRLIIAGSARQNGNKSLWQQEIGQNKKKPWGWFWPGVRSGDCFLRSFLGDPTAMDECMSAEDDPIRAWNAPVLAHSEVLNHETVD